MMVILTRRLTPGIIVVPADHENVLLVAGVVPVELVCGPSPRFTTVSGGGPRVFAIIGLTNPSKPCDALGAHCVLRDGRDGAGEWIHVHSIATYGSPSLPQIELRAEPGPPSRVGMRDHNDWLETIGYEPEVIVCSPRFCAPN